MSDSECTSKRDENGQNGNQESSAVVQGNDQNQTTRDPRRDRRDDSAGSNENFELNDGQRHGHKGSRGGSFSYRRGGRGQYRRGRGGYHNQRQQYEGYEEAPADGAVGLWNGPDKERGKGQKPRYSRGGGGAGAPRQRTKSEKSSLLDGKREPLPETDQGLDDVEDFWDVVVSGYSADMSEDDLWEVFGQQDVAAIVQQMTHDMKPYCHIYTTSNEMTKELLRCNRDTFRGNTLYVAMSEDIIARGVSLMQKKKPNKPPGRRVRPILTEASAEQQPEQSQSPEKEEEHHEEE